MANYLKVNMQESVRHFYNNLQWSKRRIARELKINRRTVSKYINEDSKCTISTTGFPVQNSDDMLSKCTISTTGSEGRKSLCAPWCHRSVKMHHLWSVENAPPLDG